MTNPKRLVVIDGKSVFYRGYYAMPHLASKEGMPTGGIYGFAMMALRILKDLKPDYVIVAWDMSKTNIRARKKIYDAYKAHRKPMPDDMRAQIPYLRKLLEAFSWPLLELDDYEADDIMGTLMEKARGKGLEVVMVTSDLDVLQLVNHHTKVCALKTGLTNIVMYDEERFTKEFNMTPQQFIDYKALRGDPSDNIPGVAGVGEKTAKQLIMDYGSLENIYEHIEEIKGAVKTKLENDKAMAYLSRDLVRIICDAPVELDLAAADVKDSNPVAIQELFTELNFRRLQQDLPEYMTPMLGLFAEPPAAEATVPEIKVANIGEGQSFERAVVYTLGKKILVSPDKKSCFIYEGSDLRVGSVIGYDLKVDLKHLAGSTEAEFDVMVAAFLLNPLVRQQSLKELAASELNITLPADSRSDDIDSLNAGLTAYAIWELQERYTQQLKELPTLDKLAQDIEWPLLRVLSKMEKTGVKLDRDYLKKMSDDFAKRIAKLESRIYHEAGQEFNINSPAQLQMIFFEKLMLPSTGIKKTKRGYSTGANELDKLRGLHPIINLVSQYRELAKLKSTYIDALPQLVDEHSRLHTTFAQTIAQTGRLSSIHPNLQNIPIRTQEGRAIRQAFIPEPGNVLVQADYTQFELRLAAVLSGDQDMIEAFNLGIDIHTQTAAELFGVKPENVTKEQRNSAKTVNFGVLYGMSPHGLSVATGMDYETANEFIQKYFLVRKGLLEYLDSLKKKAHKDGYVETLFGRRRPMPDIHSSNYMVRMAAERAAINMPIQGTEADLMKMAMIAVDAKLDEDCHQILQVHDSILVEVPKSKAKAVAKMLETTMENIYKLPVKLEVETSIGTHWGEL